jgi:hypothetical protein
MPYRHFKEIYKHGDLFCEWHFFFYKGKSAGCPSIGFVSFPYVLVITYESEFKPFMTLICSTAILPQFD